MSTQRQSNLVFWLQWVLANLVGELLGLGIVGAIGYGIIFAFGEPVSTLHIVSFAALAVGLGAIEGAIVGYSQAFVLRRRLPEIRSWVSATITGAVIAWALGMLPSTIMSLTDTTSSQSPAGISDALQLLLAVPMGLLAGTIFGIPQWLVLRRHVAQAGWWVLANALAWGCGMPLVFVAAGVRPAESVLPVVVVIVGSLTTAGAVVGAIHGAFLIALLARRHDLRKSA